MKKVMQILSYVVVVALSSAITLALFVPKAEAPSKLEELADLIDRVFIEESNRTEYEDAAAAAMVEALGDRWSYYIPADQYEAHQEQMNNAYVGIGVTILAEEGNGFLITKVTPGAPAEEAGLQAGDYIVGISGQDARNMTTQEAQGLVKGEKETPVTLTILREGEAFDREVTRREVQTPVAVLTMLEEKVGLVTIANFDARCARETIAAIESALEAGAEALIFDVRGNPGGYKDELVEILDYLLPEGPLFRSVDYRGKSSVDESDARCLEIPMAVLVNGDSYSAAEFFAAALAEYEAATVVGTQTSGKGHFQYTYELSDGSAVGLSVGRYTTPKDVNLDGVGITPDLVVEVDEETAFAIYAGTLPAEEDPQVLAALEVLGY